MVWRKRRKILKRRFSSIRRAASCIYIYIFSRDSIISKATATVENHRFTGWYRFPCTTWLVTIPYTIHRYTRPRTLTHDTTIWRPLTTTHFHCLAAARFVASGLFNSKVVFPRSKEKLLRIQRSIERTLFFLLPSLSLSLSLSLARSLFPPLFRPETLHRSFGSVFSTALGEAFG